MKPLSFTQRICGWNSESRFPSFRYFEGKKKNYKWNLRSTDKIVQSHLLQMLGLKTSPRDIHHQPWNAIWECFPFLQGIVTVVFIYASLFDTDDSPQRYPGWPDLTWLELPQKRRGCGRRPVNLRWIHLRSSSCPFHLFILADCIISMFVSRYTIWETLYYLGRWWVRHYARKRKGDE